MTTEQTKTIAYIRVSTSKQADNGMSLDTQRAKLKAYAAIYDLDLVDVVVDGGSSAGTLNRPGLQKALNALRSGEAEALLVTKLDRLTRSVVDLGTLVDDFFAGGDSALLSMSEQIDTRSAAGRLVLNVLASVAQWERETVSERTSEVMRHKSSHGGYVGGRPPFGFRLKNGELVEDAQEQTIIALARELRARGSLRVVSRQLAEHGHRARNGRPFSAVQISRMLDETDRTFRSAA